MSFLSKPSGVAPGVCLGTPGGVGGGIWEPNLGVKPFMWLGGCSHAKAVTCQLHNNNQRASETGLAGLAFRMQHMSRAQTYIHTSKDTVHYCQSCSNTDVLSVLFITFPCCEIVIMHAVTYQIL